MTPQCNIDLEVGKHQAIYVGSSANYDGFIYMLANKINEQFCLYTFKQEMHFLTVWDFKSFIGRPWTFVHFLFKDKAIGK